MGQRSLPGGVPGDLVWLPLYRLPITLADAIGRFARRRNLGDLTDFGLPIPEDGVMARPGLEHLVGHLGVLGPTGKPIAWGETPATDGLWFIGYDVHPSLIGYMAKQSKRIARRIACEASAA